MKKNLNRLIFCLLFLLLVFAVLFGAPIRGGVQYGLYLSYKAVIPALFPSMVLCGLLGEYARFIPLRPTITIWLISNLCGFPMGIRTVSAAYQTGLITREQAIRLSACCSNASPAFLILYVGDMLLKNRTAGVFIFLGQTLISFWIALILNAFTAGVILPAQEKPFLSTVCDSFASAATGCLSLIAYVTAFSVFGVFLKKAPFFYALLEITGGLSAMGPAGKDLIVAAIGFSGCSVMMQSVSYLSAAGLPIRPLLAAKTVYGILLPVVVRTLPGSIWIWILPFFVFFFDKWRKKQYNVKKGRKRALL